MEVTSKTLSPTVGRRGVGQKAPTSGFASVRTMLVLGAVVSLGWLLFAPSTPALILLASSVIGTLGWRGAPSGSLTDALDA